MSQNLSSLIESLRTATARDSVTPSMLSDIFTAMRGEYEQLMADAASGGELNLQSINDAIDAIDAALKAHEQEAADSLDSLDKYARQMDVALAKRITALENIVSDTPGVVNAPSILHFEQIITGMSVSSPIVQGSTSAAWYPVYYAPGNIFAARLASYSPGSPLSAGEKLYTSNTGTMYNKSIDCARTDILFAMGNDLYMHNGEALVQLTSNPVIIQ